MSLKTDNFKLYKYEDNDIGDLRFINDSMDIIDKGINPFYVATQSSTNVYKVTTGLNKTSLANGYSIKVAIPKDSTGAVSITVDSVTVPVKKPNGNVVKNFKANGVYSLTYYNSVFILASGGMDDVNFTSDKLLTGYSANDSNGEKVNGTMPNKGAVTASLNCGGSYTILAGYHNGSGKVTANSLSSQTSANATAKDIIKGKTAWVNGSKITGTATIQSSGGGTSIECTVIDGRSGRFKYESDGFKAKNPYYVSGSSKKCYLAIQGTLRASSGGGSMGIPQAFIETTFGTEYVTVDSRSATKYDTFDGYGYWLKLA